MPTFIDESGDTGPASAYFRLAAVYVPNSSVSGLRARLATVRRELGVRPDYEFKYSKTWTRTERRTAFLRAAMCHPFHFAVHSIDKGKGTWLSATSTMYHRTSVIAVAGALCPLYIKAHDEQKKPLDDPIVVDDNQDKRFLGIVKEVFRGLGKNMKPPANLVGRVKFGDSAKDDLLQLADLVCGAVGSFLDEVNSEWYQIIAERDMWEAEGNEKRPSACGN